MAMSQVSLVIAGRRGEGYGVGRGVVGTRVAARVAGDARVKAGTFALRICANVPEFCFSFGSAFS